MNCDQVRDLILTDYVDGQLPEEQKMILDKHLKSCAACHAFALEVKKDLVVPFEAVKSEVVPTAVWENIKDTIDPQEEYEPSWKAVIKFLGNLQGLRQSAYFLASIVFVIGLSMIFFNPSSSKDKLAKDIQIQYQVASLESESAPEESITETYLAYFDEEYSDVYDGVADEYGTDIEEYFL